MDLLLWRHAEAQDGAIDFQRRLTPRGEKQAAAMGKWRNKIRSQTLRILVSPTIRCQQTAKSLGLSFETTPSLCPDASVSELISACGWPTATGMVLMIGPIR